MRYIAAALLVLFCWASFSYIYADSNAQKLDEVWNFIVEKHVNKKENTEKAKNDCFLKILKGGVSFCTDPRSSYNTKEDMEVGEVEISGTLGGVGLEVTVFGNRVIIVSPIDGSAADRSGAFKPYDVISEVDGVNVERKTIDEIVKRIQGEEGTEVSITVKRDGRKRPPVKLTREIIIIRSVRTNDIDKNIAYVKVSSFSINTLSQFFSAINERLFDHKGFVMDLRNNPGGLLHTAELMGVLFSDSGDDILYTLRSWRGEETFRVGDIVNVRKKSLFDAVETFVSVRLMPPGSFKNLHFVILINEGSASASELFAALMRDWGKAKLVGTRTFGKGSVQTVFTLPEGDGLTLTTHEYLVGNAKIAIDGVGVKPDYEVENPEQKNPIESIMSGKIDLDEDLQLKKAIEILREEIKQ